MTGMPCRRPMKVRAPRSADCPYRWTGRMALVRGVIRASTWAGSIVYVTGSTSTYTGTAPQYVMAHDVAMNVMGTVITSSPGPTPAASSARCRADVPELTATQCWAPTYSAKAASNSATLGPRMNAADSAACSRAGRTSSLSPVNWAFRSMNGTATGLAGDPVSMIVSASFSIHASDNCPSSQETGGTPGRDRSRRHVFGHNGTSPHQRAGANCHTGQDHRPAADGCALAHTGLDDLPVRLGLGLAVARSPRVEVVDEHHSVTDKDFVFNRYAFTDERVARDLAPGADGSVFLDLDKAPDARLVADSAAVQIHEAVNGDVTTQPDVGRDANAVGRVVSFVHRTTGRHGWRSPGNVELL